MICASICCGFWLLYGIRAGTTIATGRRFRDRGHHSDWHTDRGSRTDPGCCGSCCSSHQPGTVLRSSRILAGGPGKAAGSWHRRRPAAWPWCRWWPPPGALLTATVEGGEVEWSWYLANGIGCLPRDNCAFSVQTANYAVQCRSRFELLLALPKTFYIQGLAPGIQSLFLHWVNNLTGVHFPQPVLNSGHPFASCTPKNESSLRKLVTSKLNVDKLLNSIL